MIATSAAPLEERKRSRRPQSDSERAARGMRPSVMLVRVVAIVLGTLLIAPVVPVVSLDPLATAYWFAVTLALWAGLRVGEEVPVKVRHRRVPDYLRVTRRVVILGAIGIVLLVVDRYGIRGAPLEWDILGTRDAIENTATGAVGVLGAFFSAFAPFALILAFLATSLGQPPSRRLWLCAASVVSVYLVLSLMVGSRSLLLVIVIIHLLSGVFVSRVAGKPVPVRKVLLGFGALLATIFTSAVVMLERLEQMGLDPMVSLQISGYAESVQASPAALAFIDAYPTANGLFAALFSLCLYVYHGFFEFNLLFVNFRDAHTMGAWEFWLPIKLASVATGMDMTTNPATLIGVREGLFTTFVGPLYVDFGWFGPIAALIFGWCLSQPLRLLRANSHLWLPAAAMVGTVVLLYPVINLIDSAAGSYLIVAALMLTRFGNRRPARRRGTGSEKTAGTIEAPQSTS